MHAKRRAVIDVGTNSVKLLVADVEGRDVSPVLEESHQTRLGQGFFSTHVLQPSRIAETASTVAVFADRARSFGADTTRVIATSAARDATNAGQLLEAIRTASGLDTEIISGEQEADWAFRGATSDPALATEPLLLLDLGGGSTECILGCGDQVHFRHSFRLGTVRLLETTTHSDPPTLPELESCQERVADFLRDQVRPGLGPELRQEAKLDRGPVLFVGTGGTATILARMEARLEVFDRARLEAARLPLERLEWHLNHLWSLPLTERRQVVGLPANRADVILTGVVVFHAMAREFGFPELRITTRGLRFAAVMD